MTTVAADARTGVMVADTMVSDGVLRTRMRKITRVGDALVGVAGEVSEIQAWLKWYQAGQRGAKPKVTTFSALVLTKKGLTQHIGTSEMEVEQGFLAIGSGCMAAQALLVAGHTVEEAVTVACEVDPNSSLPIHVESLAAS